MYVWVGLIFLVFMLGILWLLLRLKCQTRRIESATLDIGETDTDAKE